MTERQQQVRDLYEKLGGYGAVAKELGISCTAVRYHLNTPYGKRIKERIKGRPKLPATERRANMKKHHGITVADYNRLYDEQGGCCAICGVERPNGTIRGLYVDHCHETGKIRGLLCPPCNFRMSVVDNPDWLAKGQAYKERTS